RLHYQAVFQCRGGRAPARLHRPSTAGTAAMSDLDSHSHGIRDAAVILPFAVAALLLPPLVLVFATPTLVAGIPLIVFYIYGVWALAVMGAFLIARRLEVRERARGE